MNTAHTLHRSSQARRQRGVVLLFALISVLIVMLAAVALIRSMNASLFSAGNIAFKRDLQNASETAVKRAVDQFRGSSPLAGKSARFNNVPAANYSASTLGTTSISAHQNIPLALQSTSSMTSAGFTDPDLPAGTGVTTRYVIERLCDSAGDETTLGTNHCLTSQLTQPGGQGNDQKNAGVNSPGALCGSPPAPCQSAQSLGIIYRITVRAEGPRNTLSFFQSTITAP